ncbi:tapasin-related protein [Aplochiton taeniatus]
MLFKIIFFWCALACVSAEGAADLVLACSLVEEGGGMGGMGGGALFTRTPATLVIRDVTVASDSSPETLTPFNLPEVADPDSIIFESKASSPEIPEAGLLLHADCNEQEVTCEISRYFPQGSQDNPEPAYFIGSLQLEGGGLSLTLVLQTLVVETDLSNQPPLIQSKLELPLSRSGTLLTEVVFLVFSKFQSVSAALRGETFLDCGFRQQGPTPGQEVGLEWRLQHRGHGRKVLEMRMGPAMESPVVNVEREGSSVDAHQLVRDGNASVTLTKLKVSDEGTYICTVRAGLFQAQTIVQLHVTQPPGVALSEEKLVFQDESPQRLSCHCRNYYPLDSQMEWFALSPTDTEPTDLTEQSSFSSHRQNSDGTFCLSSHITLVPSSLSPGTTITCKVSHVALATPVSVSLTVEKSEPDSYLMVLGFLVITVLFFYQVMR